MRPQTGSVELAACYCLQQGDPGSMEVLAAATPPSTGAGDSPLHVPPHPLLPPPLVAVSPSLCLCHLFACAVVCH